MHPVVMKVMQDRRYGLLILLGDFTAMLVERTFENVIELSNALNSDGFQDSFPSGTYRLDSMRLNDSSILILKSTVAPLKWHRCIDQPIPRYDLMGQRIGTK